MKRIGLSLLLFVLVVVSHLILSNRSILPGNSLTGGLSWAEYPALYLRTRDILLGISYGVGAVFILHVLWKYIETPDKLKVLRGLVPATVLFLALFFGLGLNGEWLFDFYASRVGWVYSTMLKPLFLLVTLLSVAVGTVLIRRQTRG